MVGSMEQVCVFLTRAPAQESYIEGDYVTVAPCPTVTAQWQDTWNF
jgi:hypothetical protein